MEDELKQAFSDVSVELIAGHGGVFEITADSKLIYTRARTGRFPNAGEITDLIKNLD